ncbi:MAG: SlyX family protein [Desulfovibrio sp.]|nr:SlyX family protein [Desulfovibrio sp.]
METEERVNRLEETLYFQDNMLKELNDALTKQQKQLDQLEHHLEHCAAQIAYLREVLATRPEDVKPPHHLPDNPLC